MRRVGRRIDVDSEPGRGAADALSHGCSMLTDARREHQRIEASQSSSQRTDLSPYSIHVEIDSLCRTRIARVEQFAHVGRDAGHPEQAGATIEKIFDGARIHVQFVHQIEQDTGIDGPTAAAHGQPVQGSEAHGGGNACTGTHGAQARTITQMRDDDPARRSDGVKLRQGSGDVLVGQTVKAVAMHAALGDLGRQREGLGDRWLGTMKRRIKTGDLRQVGTIQHQAPNRREIVRLVQRRQRDELVQGVIDACIHAHRATARGATMHDTMTHGAQIVASASGIKMLEEQRQCSVMRHGLAVRPVTSKNLRAGGVRGAKMRRRIQTLKLAVLQTLQAP